MCSHGHKLQFGDVQQALNTGDPIKRKQPLLVRMPPDGLPGEPRGVWVQLLGTVSGLADGTREWRNCFLAASGGLGFETSVLEPCVLVLRSTQQKYHGIIGVAVDDYCWWRRCSLGTGNLQFEATFHLRTLGRENSAVERWCKQQMDPCVLGSLLTSRVWTLPLALGKLRKEQLGDANVNGTCLSESCRVVLTRPRLAKAHTDLALLVCKFSVINSVLCLIGMPVV